MIRRAGLAAALIVAPSLLVTLTNADETPPSVKEIMTKLHKGANSLLVDTRTHLQKGQPDWDALEKKTKDIVILGAALARNDPPRGDRESWQRLSRQYYDHAKTLDEAVQAKDRPAALNATKQLGESCKACHNAHKGR